MGRSATLCKQPQELRSSTDVFEYRNNLLSNLKEFLAGDDCVSSDGVSELGPPSDYVDLVGDGIVAVLKLELHSDRVAAPNEVTLPATFASLFAEAWRCFSVVSSSIPGMIKLSSGDAATVELLSRSSIASIIEKSNGLTARTDKESQFHELAELVSKSFQKAMREVSAAIDLGDTEATHHHTLILGDLAEELLKLHSQLVSFGRS